MEFWDEVYKKVSDAASYTAKETGKLTELAKAKYALMREKSRLEDAYEEMGKLYYSQMKNADIEENELSIAYDKIEKSIEEIERIKTQINVINSTVVCDGCGEKLDKDMAFCHKCGKKLKKDDEQDQSEDNN